MKLIFNFPDSALMPNRKNGRHWATYQKAKEKARIEGFYVAKEANKRIKYPFLNVPLSIMFYFPTKHKRDLDNLLSAMKYHLDGIAKALEIDDTQFYPIVISKDIDPNKKGFVEVIIDADS
ncbi:hypothetical protein V757_01000 [Pelistega indica]|uniref:Uncharacterized protein n=1 Tax=Pelistega indica TaxID=1414851 RepID=V8GA63_9BURK|nr:RusA family crossover junction endodeoxyribonuclease [Pelistega indica]ETD72986.1 hypothetical protein V757_01000 [Pelistega indica]